MDESANLFPGMNSRLYVAGERGNVDTLNDLIQGEVKLNMLQEFTDLGNSVLHIAVSSGNLQFIAKLLQEVNKDLVAGREFLRAKNSHGNSAFHLAAFYGHHKLVEKFLGLLEGDPEAGDFLSSVNREGNTALHEAAKGGNYEVVKVLLNHDPDHRLTSVSNAAGETALFIASQSGHTNIVERLLPLMTSNTNMKREDGQTPLHSAVFYRRTGVVKKLLELRPDLLKQTDECGRTVLHMLALSPGWRYRPWYDRLRGGETPLGRIAGLLLEEDNSLCYKQDNKKQSPLHIAVEEGNYQLVGIILNYGKDCIELVDNDGRKPLHIAVINAVEITRRYDVSELLRFKNMLISLMSRESLNYRDNEEKTALQIAMEKVKEDLGFYMGIRELLERNGALQTPKIIEESRSIRPLDARSVNAGTISINAVLISTVSFAAAFTLPGGVDSQPGEKPKAVFINTLLFKLFVICDTFAFCSSIASAILVQYSGKNEREEQMLVANSLRLLLSALTSLLVAFGASVHIVIAPSPWLAGMVWTMVFLVPMAILIVFNHSKRLIFVEERYKIFVLGSPLVFLIIIFFTLADIFLRFLLSVVFSSVTYLIKKHLKRRG